MGQWVSIQQWVQKTAFVSVQAQKHMGRLMGKGGKKSTGISYVTGCNIIVPKFKDRPPEEPVEIVVYGEDQLSLTEAVRLIAKCFEET